MSNGDDEVYSNFDLHDEGDEWYDEGEEVYEKMLDDLLLDFPEVMNQETADLLWDGWFNGDITPSERVEIRMEFFYQTDIEWEDFDWESWREWYDTV